MSDRLEPERHLEIPHTVAETVSRSLDVEEVPRTALDALTHVTGHEISSLHLLSEDGATLKQRGDRGLSAPLREINQVLAVGQGPIGRVAATGLSVAYGIVAEHRGTLRGGNRLDRRGAIFTIELPAGAIS